MSRSWWDNTNSGHVDRRLSKAHKQEAERLQRAGGCWIIIIILLVLGSLGFFKTGSFVDTIFKNLMGV